MASGVETRRLPAGRGTSYLTPSPDGQSVYARTFTRTSAPSDSAGIRDYGHRCRTSDRPRASAAAQCRRCLPPGVFDRRPPRHRVPVTPQEPHPAGARRAWRDFRRFVDPVRRGCGRAGASADRRTGELLHHAVRRGHRAGQERRLRLHQRRQQRDRHRRQAAAAVRARGFARDRRALANDLSASAHFVAARIPVGRNPKGLALSPDGARLYVANRLDDTVSVIDTATRKGDAHHRTRRTGRTHAPAPRRAAVLRRALRLPRRLELLQLSPGIHLRRPAMGPGAGRLRRGHRGQPPAGRYRRHRAVQVERQQSRVSKPNADRAPKSTSTARRVTRPANWATWSATSSRYRCGPTGSGCRTAN
jgi:hypothetical protein